MFPLKWKIKMRMKNDDNNMEFVSLKYLKKIKKISYASTNFHMELKDIK